MKIFRSRVVAVATGAVLLAGLGGIGGATAASMIGTDDIRNGAVTKPKVAKDSVGGAELIHGSVRSGPVADGSLGMRDLNDFTKEKIKSVGPEGPAGPVGPEGPAGPEGPVGPICPDGLELTGPFMVRTGTQGTAVHVEAWLCTPVESETTP